jgi:exopolysaccharide biosynthesis protein
MKNNSFCILRICVPGIIAFAALAQRDPARGAEPDRAFLAEHGMRYELRVKKEPRPLRIHVLEVDLSHPGIELAASVADDPDGDGPADAALEPPESLAKRSGALALINANPWESLPDRDGKTTAAWREGQPVKGQGLIVSKGKARSRSPAKGAAFWIDETGSARIGKPEAGAGVREGVAGFSQVLREGVVVPPPDKVLHPRSALGLDGRRRTLRLVVVDGRQPGFSEGMSLEELATLMKDLGCADAVNLDGGGSSILILCDAAGNRRIMNDPSTKLFGKSMPRPLPDALVIRRKGA